MRFAAAFVLSASFLLAAFRGPLLSYRANLVRQQANRLLWRAEQSAGYERRRLAQGAIAKATECLEVDPADFEALVIRGAAEAASGDHTRAIGTYHAAQQLNERPEIYGYIGVAQLENGEMKQAIDNLIKAATFNVMFSAIVDAPTQEIISAAVKKRREELRARGHQRAKS